MNWSPQSADLSPIELVWGELDWKIQREYQKSESGLLLIIHSVGRAENMTASCGGVNNTTEKMASWVWHKTRSGGKAPVLEIWEELNTP